jgi:hypothetical protein
VIVTWAELACPDATVIESDTDDTNLSQLRPNGFCHEP